MSPNLITPDIGALALAAVDPMIAKGKELSPLNVMEQREADIIKNSTKVNPRNFEGKGYVLPLLQKDGAFRLIVAVTGDTSLKYTSTMISLDEPSNRGRKNRDAKKPTEIPSITMDFIGDRNKASAQSLITSSGPTGPIVNPLYLQEGGTKLDLTEFTPPLGDKNEPSNFRIQAASGTLHAVISQQTKTGIESHKQPDGKASAITISGDPTVFTGAKLVKNTDPSSKAAYNLILQHANKEQGVDVLAEGPLTLETQTVENGKPITRALEVLDKDGKLMSGLTPDNFAEKIKAMPVKAESQAAAPTPTSPPKKSASR